MKLIAGLVAVVVALTTLLIVWSFKGSETRDLTQSSASPTKEQARFGTVHLECSSGSCEFGLQLTLKKMCQLGDFDLIEMDMDTATPKDKRFLTLTVESMREGDDFPVVHRTFDFSEFSQSPSFTLEIPRVDQAKQLGIFLCKDSEQTGTCRNKEYIDITHLPSKNAEGRQKNPNYRSPDRVFYYQYVLYTPSGEFSFFNDPTADDLTQTMFDTRWDYIRARLDEPNSQDEEDFQRWSKDLAILLRSMPLETQDGTLYAVFPRLDAPNCQSSIPVPEHAKKYFREYERKNNLPSKFPPGEK